MVKLYQFYGDIYVSEGLSEAEMEVQNNALSGFLSSSLNVELVYILLESITTFSKKTSGLTQNENSIVTQTKNEAAAGDNYMTAVVEPIDEKGDLNAQIRLQ